MDHENPDSETISSSRSSKLDFVEKEFRENKITIKLLTDLLAKEEKRKTLLEARELELTQVTKEEILDRVESLNLKAIALSAFMGQLRSQFIKVLKGKLPNKCDHPDVFSKLEEIEDLEKSRDYVLVTHFIMLVSSKISTHLRDKNYTEAITMFNQLRSLRDVVLSSCDATHLNRYCSGVVETWEVEVHDRVAAELAKWLEKVGWPSTIDTASPSDDTIKRFQNTIRCFTRLTNGKPKPSFETGSRPIVLIDYTELSALAHLLVKPIRKRFRYHFYSSKATADDTKPEWYFTQVKQWVRELVPFLSKYVEPIQVEVCKSSLIVEFVQGLSELLVLKTDTLLSPSNTRIDDSIFTKILEESSRYETDMKNLLDDYKLGKSDQEKIPGLVNTIFSPPHILSRWLSIEKRGSLEKLDILFSSASAWNRVIVPGPTEIAELFVMMLRFVVDRFAYLRQPGQKIQFVQLVIEILDDFRIRCLQIWKSSSSVENLDFLVAETLGYVHGILLEWEDSPFFTHLNFFWDTIRTVEKEDLDHRSNRRLSPAAKNLEETDHGGLFAQVRERYASSMEILIMSISQR